MAQPVALSAAAEPPARHSALGEEVLAVFAYTPASLAGLAAGFFMLAPLFWASTPKAVLLPWMVLFVGLWVVRIVLAQRFAGAVRRHEGEVDWARWRLYWNVMTLCSAGAWGLSGWLFYTRGLGI